MMGSSDHSRKICHVLRNNPHVASSAETCSVGLDTRFCLGRLGVSDSLSDSLLESLEQSEELTHSIISEGMSFSAMHVGVESLNLKNCHVTTGASFLNLSNVKLGSCIAC